MPPVHGLLPARAKKDITAFAANGQGFAEPGTVAVGAGQAVVDVDAGGDDSQCEKSVALGGEVLLVGGAAGIADEYAVMAHLLAEAGRPRS